MSTLVFLEHHGDEVLKPSLAVLSKAASLGDEVSGIVIGSSAIGSPPPVGLTSSSRGRMTRSVPVRVISPKTAASARMPRAVVSTLGAAQTSG